MKLPQMTYDEDIRYLANAECRSGSLDSIRFIPLSAEDENRYLSFGVWIRERGEYVSNPTFNLLLRRSQRSIDARVVDQQRTSLWIRDQLG